MGYKGVDSKFGSDRGERMKEDLDGYDDVSVDLPSLGLPRKEAERKCKEMTEKAANKTRDRKQLGNRSVCINISSSETWSRRKGVQ